MANSTQDQCVVTGGSGFVGKALCHALLERGYKVVSVSRRDVPELRDRGVTIVQQDLLEGLGALKEYLPGTTAIFHTAAKVGMWGGYSEFLAANVGVTEKLLRAARKYKVNRFIYTSSPSVIADGSDLCGVNEEVPYPKHYEAFYPQTKAGAEQLVLNCHDRAALRTIALRPHLIFGPGDTNLIPAILDKARKGRLVRVGDGSNLTDVTFIEDCVQAHLDAFDALLTNPEVGGRAYFISQGEPVKMWEWINQVLACFGEPPVTRSIPVWLARLIGGLCETWASVTGGAREPALTRFLVSEMATSHFFDLTAACRDLGYKPKYTVEEALEKTKAAYASRQGASSLSQEGATVTVSSVNE